MAYDSSSVRRRGRGLQPVLLLLAAVAQIATALLMNFLHIGVDVGLRSALTSHPLVPAGPAFTIWGVIYLFSLVSAIWQMLPNQKYNLALETVGWNLTGIYLINAIWQIWVPVEGFDWVSSALVFVALMTGLSGLVRLRLDMVLVRHDEIMVFAPLALVTGWLTAACFLNFTTVLVAGNYGLDPTYVGVSLAFLIGLILFSGVMAWIVESLVFSGALIWALAWIMIANIYRESQPSMVTACLIGMAVVGLVTAWAVTHRHESTSMSLHGS